MNDYPNDSQPNPLAGFAVKMKAFFNDLKAFTGAIPNRDPYHVARLTALQFGLAAEHAERIANRIGDQMATTYWIDMPGKRTKDILGPAYDEYYDEFEWALWHYRCVIQHHNVSGEPIRNPNKVYIASGDDPPSECVIPQPETAAKHDAEIDAIADAYYKSLNGS